MERVRVEKGLVHLLTKKDYKLGKYKFRNHYINSNEQVYVHLLVLELIWIIQYKYMELMLYYRIHNPIK